jgi:hypothetical protein
VTQAQRERPNATRAGQGRRDTAKGETGRAIRWIDDDLDRPPVESHLPGPQDLDYRFLCREAGCQPFRHQRGRRVAVGDLAWREDALEESAAVKRDRGGHVPNRHQISSHPEHRRQVSEQTPCHGEAEFKDSIRLAGLGL